MLLYGSFSFLQLLINSSLEIFGHNDFGLRFVMIFFHLMSIILIYLISERYIKIQRNRLWLTLIYALLPGVVSSAVVVNSAGMIIFGLLLFIYLHEKVPQFFVNLLLLIFSLIDIGFAYLFLGLSIYYFKEKKLFLSMYVLSLYILTSSLYGFNIFGYPKGHFLDTIGVYSAVFTPIIFVYLFYTLYRRYLTQETSMVWYIATTTLVISLLLSFRQRIAIEDFAPYLIIALPLAGESFINSYRVRLKRFRIKYKIAFVASFVFLILNTLIVLFNKEIYFFIDNPKHHFAYEMHIAKELARELKNMEIKCVNTDNKMQKRLQFYEIDYCKDNSLKSYDIKDNKGSNVTISYKNIIVYRANVTNLNN
ncbi:MAG: hypothetical protein U9N39_08210 [Campylobacterota bacterium]|nr:hypothetical protein [Campylobacterota bacterium]